MEALWVRGDIISTSFLTSAVEGGEWSASRPCRALPPGKEPPVPIVEEAGWAPEPVWTQRLEEKSCTERRESEGRVHVLSPEIAGQSRNILVVKKIEKV
jgi:hypothetical protein